MLRDSRIDVIAHSDFDENTAGDSERRDYAKLLPYPGANAIMVESARIGRIEDTVFDGSSAFPTMGLIWTRRSPNLKSTTTMPFVGSVNGVEHQGCMASEVVSESDCPLNLAPYGWRDPKSDEDDLCYLNTEGSEGGTPSFCYGVLPETAYVAWPTKSDKSGATAAMTTGKLGMDGWWLAYFETMTSLVSPRCKSALRVYLCAVQRPRCRVDRSSGTQRACGACKSVCEE